MTAFVRKTLSGTDAKVLALIAEAINEDIQSTAQMVTQGKCKDFAEYRDKTGYLHGLVRGLERIEETRKKYEQA